MYCIDFLQFIDCISLLFQHKFHLVAEKSLLDVFLSLSSTLNKYCILSLKLWSEVFLVILHSLKFDSEMLITSVLCYSYFAHAVSLNVKITP